MNREQTTCGDGRATRLAVLVSGSGSNLQAVLDACDDGRLDAEVALVVSNRANAFGLQRAEDAGVATRYHPLGPYRERGDSRERYDADLGSLVAEADPAFVVLAGWMHILSRHFLDHFPDRVVNLHPALPGTFPGAHAIDDALEAFARGEVDHTGVMVHLVPDERVDEGPVLASDTVAIVAGDTHETLAARIHETEHRLLVDALAELISRG